MQLGPEGEMLVSDIEYEKPPKPIRDKIGGLDYSKDLMEIKVDALKRWFYIDKFQMFSDLSRLNKQPVTATQIWQMAGEKATLLSPAIETHSRYLETTDSRMVDIEMRAGRGPFAPDVMANITDIVLSNITRPTRSVGIQPVFMGALAQAQKLSQALEPIQSGIQALMPLAEMFPDLPALMIREYDTGDDLLQATDFPQKNIVPKDEYAEKKAALAEARAKEKQALLAIEAAKASTSLQGPVDETSVLAGATG